MHTSVHQKPHQEDEGTKEEPRSAIFTQTLVYFIFFIPVNPDQFFSAVKNSKPEFSDWVNANSPEDNVTHT